MTTALLLVLAFQDEFSKEEAPPALTETDDLGWGATVAAGFGDLFRPGGETIELLSVAVHAHWECWFAEVEIQRASTQGRRMHLFDALGGARGRLGDGAYFLFAAGFSCNDADDPEPFLLGGPFNIVLRVGLGCEFSIGSAWGLQVEARITHWSNLAIDEPGEGLNVVQLAASIIIR